MQIGLYSAVNGCMAYATDVAGKCHGYRWQTPQTSLANAVNYLANAMEKKIIAHTRAKARGKRLSYES